VAPPGPTASHRHAAQQYTYAYDGEYSEQPDSFFESSRGYGSLRVIAGEFRGLKGPVVLKGSVHSGTEAIGTTEVGIFDRTGDHIRIDTLRMQQRFFSAVNRSMSRSWAAVPS
jgi:hypothetical protein